MQTRVWVVLVACGPAYAIAGVFDNRVAALKCVDTFEYKQGSKTFAYAQEFIVGEQLRLPLSMVRQEPVAS